jgi:Protein of unknown function (DUF3455)
LVPYLQEKFMQSHLATTVFFRVLLLAGAASLVACAPATPLSPTAATANASASTAPAALRPADNERAVFTWNAAGSQIYECRASDKGGFAWVFVAPEADLFDQNRRKAGTHGAGPFWAALDGSRIIGTVKASADGARPGDIPLLLLTTKPAGGPGRMTNITSVQRLNTVGGGAPASGCETPSDAGKRIKQGYTADYVFFAIP